MAMKWLGLGLGLLFLVFLVQNWQPLLPVILFGQAAFVMPLGLAFLLAFSLGMACAWGLDRWVGMPKQLKPEVETIVLEPEDVQYPRRRSPSEDEWDFVDDWD
jgi:uncharacterized integral membrane protein